MPVTDAQVEAAITADRRYRVEGTPDGDHYAGPPYKVDGPWYLIDTDRADNEVGYSGDLVSEHVSCCNAWRAQMRLVLEAAERAPQEPCSARVELAQAVEKLAIQAMKAGRYEDAETLHAAVRCIDTGDDPVEP